MVTACGCRYGLQIARAGCFGTRGQGRARAAGLGPFPAVTLAEARRKAAEARRLLAQGIDPLAHKQGSVTFATVVSLYIKAHRPGWRSPKHAGEVEPEFAGPCATGHG